MFLTSLLSAYIAGNRLLPLNKLAWLGISKRR